MMIIDDRETTLYIINTNLFLNEHKHALYDLVWRSRKVINLMGDR